LLPLAAVAGLIVVGSVILTAVGGRHERVQARSDGFWQTALLEGSEVEWFDSMEEMLASSDAVVVARPVSFSPGRVFGDDKLKTYAYYGVMTLKVEQVLKGTPGDTVDLEIATVEPQVLDRLSATMPSDRAIYFLRNKATEARLYGPPPGSSVEAEARYWRLINSQGIYRDAGGKVAAPVNAEAEYAIQADGMPFETLVQSITMGENLPGS
jgi:hypothetical protein